MSTNLFTRERAGQVRASECCVIMGTPGFMGKDITDLMLQLKHGIPFEPKTYTHEEDEEDDETDDQRRGHLYEPIALDLAAKDLEMTVDYAKDQDDGIRRFSKRHPKYDFMGAMPDAVFEDDWLGEVKAPRPIVVRKQIEEGVYARHVWQMTMQLACWPDAPGVRFILYDCVACRTHIYSFPREAMKVKELEDRCVRFWERHIAGDEPFNPDEWRDTVPLPKIDPLAPSEYQLVESDAWRMVTHKFAVAKWKEKQFKGDKESVGEMIKEAAKKSKLNKFNVDGHKFIVSDRVSRIFDKRLLKLDYPQIDFENYMVDGKRFTEIKHYPPKGWKGEN